jgi:competence protein ComEA
MGRRITADDQTAAIASERRARLLRDLGPQRALPAADDPTPPRPGEGEQSEPVPVRLRSFGRRHLGVVALLLVIGLGAAGWALLRARPIAVATSVAVSTSGVAGPVAKTRSSPNASEPASTPSATILVHVLGAVRHPGVVSVPEGSRVHDVLDAAGGLAAQARPGELNLAQIVQDGQQIVIGTRGDPGGDVRGGSAVAGTGGGPGSSALGTGPPVDLNRATSAELEGLPGVGPVTAERILAWRSAHGRFTRVEELQEVDGIGPKTFARIVLHVRV